MVSCNYCGNNVALPFKCSYCGRSFCSDHRLPESHECDANFQVIKKIQTPRATGNISSNSSLNIHKKSSFVNKYLISGLIIGLVLGGILFPTFISAPKYQDALEEIDQLNQQIAELQLELDTYEQDIAEKQMKLSIEETKYNALEKKYNDLEDDWNELVSDWNELVDDYDTLNEENTGLIHEWNDLVKSWNNLVENYNNLTQENTNLWYMYYNVSIYKDYWTQHCNESIQDGIIPSLIQLRSFLWSDKIDQVTYSDNFQCRHYALILSIKARSRNWRMGVVTIIGYIEDGSEYAHAINAIITTDGCVYIEPQTDEIWWYENYSQIEPIGSFWNINEELVNVTKVTMRVSY